MHSAIKYLNWNAEYLTRIYFFLGSCTWQFQLFEDTLCKFIVLALKLDATTARDEALQILDKNKKSTLGQLIRELGKRSDVPADLDTQMDRFLQDRNWIIHHSYADFLKVGHDRVACDLLLVRIGQIDAESYRLTHVFWDAVDVLATEYEAEDSEIRSLAQQVREAWTPRNKGGSDEREQL